MVAMLKTIFAQENAEAAREQWTSVADALRERCPKLVDLMDRSREEVLVYMSFPRALAADCLDQSARAAQRRDQAALRCGGHLPQ